MRVWQFVGLIAVLAMITMSAQAYQLRFKDTAGATRTYTNAIQVNGTAQAMGFSVPVSGTVNFTLVEKVNTANGTANITTTLQNGTAKLTLTMPGQEEAQTINQPIPTITITYDRTPLGAVSNVKTSGLSGDVAGMPSQLLNNIQTPGQTLQFPARELQVGDTWTGTQSIPLGPGNNATVNVTYTLVGEETVNGRTFLRVTTVATANVPSVTITASQLPGQPPTQMTLSLNLNLNGSTLFDAAAGQVNQSTYTGTTATTIIPEGGTADSAITVNLNINGTMQQRQ